MSLEENLKVLLSLQSQCVSRIPEDVSLKIRIIRERCLQAEKSESVDGLSSWRRSHIKQGSNADKDGKQYRWRGKGNGGQRHADQRHADQRGVDQRHADQRGVDQRHADQRGVDQKAEPKGQRQWHAHGRYKSKFKTSGMEDTILNQVILNKLNKFSLTNYDEVKSFLQQILDGNDTSFLKSFMKLVFQKAASEPTFCPLYARMISELAQNYDILCVELSNLYSEYLSIFDEVSETSCENYEQFVQTSKEKQHRLGYSQFLAELTKRGVLDFENLTSIFQKILDQIHAFGTNSEKQSLVDEYTQCLLRMTQAFCDTKLPQLLLIRQKLFEVCGVSMRQLVEQRTPGISKRASFACMDCLDIFKS